jgi:uncharacterized protein
MAKPSGAICNIDCTYCFYLEKEKLYPDKSRDSWRMGDEELEAYVRQYIEAQDIPMANFAWQGGEPTLLGVDFFRKAVELQRQYAGKKQITNAFQTNAILLDDEWGEFLAEENFLVGVSIDGPEDIHNRYRVTRGGDPTWDKVMAGIEVLKKSRVEFNTLTVLHKHNADHPKELYEFLTREVGSHFLQFIPIVERVADNLPAHFLQLVGPEFREGATVAEWSVGSEQYGRFLNGVFDQWVQKDIGQYFIQIFDTTLAGWMGQDPGLCIFSETCGDAMIVEHDGDVYSCDHFVYPDYKLGNIADTSIREMAESPEQRKFGTDKRDALPDYCRNCEFRFACNGGCPKQRFIKTPEGEEGLNYLCKGYKTFFGHTKPYMKAMARELRNGQPAANIMAKTKPTPESSSSQNPYVGVGRNSPCPCGSGKKFKRCHGLRATDN